VTARPEQCREAVHIGDGDGQLGVTEDPQRIEAAYGRAERDQHSTVPIDSNAVAMRDLQQSLSAACNGTRGIGPGDQPSGGTVKSRPMPSTPSAIRTNPRTRVSSRLQLKLQALRRLDAMIRLQRQIRIST
jgi:hypothetical protein